ncbi:hypothetical protein [Planctobacterium marinum]|uniref:hypothetical protein n=1 Tax=Planctobacterium marinum TaxID=1631968 RepID=UPI001E41B131|nr:hypothetical protein [Planctobacterium marinum]MCC2607715.1 hypothetical protein [Planctobacterium marinum]
MSNVVHLLPRGDNTPQENLDELVSFYASHTPFNQKADWSWDQICWNAKGVCKTQARKSHYNQYLYFSRDNAKGKNVKTSRSEMEPFHTQWLSDICKCHVSSLQIEKSKDIGTLQMVINAYRILDNILKLKTISSPILNLNDFIMAEQAACNYLKASTYYRTAKKLETIAKFIDTKRLFRNKINYKKSVKRGDVQTNSDTRIDNESITLRAEKLPSKRSLIAVAALSNHDLSGDDALFQAMTEILFATGLRFDEVVSLDVDCLYEKEIEERNVLTGKQDVFTVYEIRYKGKKGAGYQTKTIAESLLPILQKGLATAREQLQPVRDLIASIQQSEYDFFPEIPNKGTLLINDVWKILDWSSSDNLGTYLKKRKVKIFAANHHTRAQKMSAFHSGELKSKTLSLAKESIDKLWRQVQNLTPADSLQNMLFVSQYQRHHMKKKAERWKFTLITHTQISDYLSGRPELGVKSVFERHNMMFEGEPISLTSHQFRHFLNTMLNLCDTVSELEVARYFGRRYLGDNETYDHTNKSKTVLDHADAILESHNVTEAQLKEAATLFNMVDSEEALEAIQDLTTTLVTAIGLCKHDYNESPCGKHYACLRGCSEYYRVKGRKSEIEEIKKIRDDAILRVNAGKESVDAEYFNANNWLRSHEVLLAGCEKALAIEQDKSIQVGERIQLFPDGENGCSPI